MKHLIFLLLFYVIAPLADAQDTLRIHPNTAEENEELKEIDVRELPEIIKQKLASPDYSSWILQSAYREEGDDGNITQPVDSVDYVVELRKGEATIRVRFDNAGKKATGEQVRD